MPDNRGQRHPSVRSADSAVVKAVEHQAALERQANQRMAQQRNIQQANQRMPRPANVTRPTYQRPAQAMPQRQAQPMQRQAQPMQRQAQPMNARQPQPMQRPVQAMPQRQAQPMQRQAQPMQRQSQGQAVLRREAPPVMQPVMQPVPQRLQIPQQQRPANQVMPVLHTSTQQLSDCTA